MKGNKMKLNFKKTYANVQFHKWSQICLTFEQKEIFIDEIKNISNVIIVSVNEDHSKQYRTPFDCGFLVEVIGFFSENNDLFGYEFIDNFFEEQYSRLDKLLENIKPLSLEFSEIQCRNNNRFKKIEEIYPKLNEKNFESFASEFKALELLDLTLNELDSLSDDHLGKLMRYNKIVSTFKSKFEEIEDEMGEKLGFSRGEQNA